MSAMTKDQVKAIEIALAVVADNAARRYLAGATHEKAIDGAISELAERWPVLAGVIDEIVKGTYA